MALTEATHYSGRELAFRANDGIEVVLFWHERTNELTVCVSDKRSGASFALAADPREALDVFYHPYSYAAFRGVSCTDALLASSAQVAASRDAALVDRT
jgi:hypothetical protein